jgi:C4-type Zn-finger protein
MFESHLLCICFCSYRSSEVKWNHAKFPKARTIIVLCNHNLIVFVDDSVSGAA